MNRVRFPLLVVLLAFSSLFIRGEESPEEIEAVALAKISKWLEIPREHFDKTADFERAVFSRIPKGTSELESRRKIKSMFTDPPADLKVRVTDSKEGPSVGVAYFNKENRWFEVVITFKFGASAGTLNSVTIGGAQGKE